MSFPKYLSASEQNSPGILVVTGNLTTWKNAYKERCRARFCKKKSYIVLSFMHLLTINDETLFTIY